jgi:hypothetical protein
MLGVRDGGGAIAVDNALGEAIDSAHPRVKSFKN